MRASSTLAAAFSPGSVFTMWAATGSPVWGTCSVSGTTVTGAAEVTGTCTVNHVPATTGRRATARYAATVPLYEFRCRTCDDTFEVRRPMSEAGDPATCPQGHPGAVRLLSVFASTGGAPAEIGRAYV